MKAKHWAMLAAGAAGGWALWRVRQADRAGLHWSDAFRYWSRSIPEAKALVDERVAKELARLSQIAREVGPARTRPGVSGW